MHISMKANYKAVGSSCAGCRHCRHAARHGLQAPGSITPLSAALQHTHTACLQHSTAALQTRQNVNCCSMQQYDKVLITVPKEIKMLVQKGKDQWLYCLHYSSLGIQLRHLQNEQRRDLVHIKEATKSWN